MSLLLHGQASLALHLPQVVVDGHCVHGDGQGLCGHEAKLLAVAAVLVQLVGHLAGDGARPGAQELDDLLRVGEVTVNPPVLAAAVAQQDQQVVGFALLQLLFSGGDEILIS